MSRNKPARIGVHHGIERTGPFGPGGSSEIPEENVMVRMSRKRIEFRYSLSDLRLYRVGFNAVIAEQPFDPKAKPLDLPLEVPEIPADADVIIHAGQHINGQVPKVRATSS